MSLSGTEPTASAACMVTLSLRRRFVAVLKSAQASKVIFVRRDPVRLLASLYVANPTPRPITLKWAQLLQQMGQNPVEIEVSGWRDLNIPSGCGAHLEDI